MNRMYQSLPRENVWDFQLWFQVLTRETRRTFVSRSYNMSSSFIFLFIHLHSLLFAPNHLFLTILASTPRKRP